MCWFFPFEIWVWLWWWFYLRCLLLICFWNDAMNDFQLLQFHYTDKKCFFEKLFAYFHDNEKKRRSNELYYLSRHEKFRWFNFFRVGCKEVLLHCFVVHELNSIKPVDLFCFFYSWKIVDFIVLRFVVAILIKPFWQSIQIFFFEFNDCWFNNSKFVAGCYECVYSILHKKRKRFEKFTHEVLDQVALIVFQYSAFQFFQIYKKKEVTVLKSSKSVFVLILMKDLIFGKCLSFFVEGNYYFYILQQFKQNNNTISCFL